MQDEFTLRQKRGIGDTVSATFSYLKIHFIPLMKVLIIIPTAFILIGSISLGIFYGELFDSIAQSNMNPDFGFSGFMFIAMLLLFLGLILFQGSIIEYMKISLTKSPSEIQLSHILDGLKKKIGYYIAGSILIYIIVVVGTVLLILPGILLIVVFSVYFFAIGIDDKDPGSAISRSFELVWGNWWKSFAIYFIMYLITMAIVYVLYIPFSFLPFLSGFSSGDPSAIQEGMGTYMTYFMPIMSMISSYTGVILFVAVGINYFSLVEEKEEVGLKERIEAIEE